ncbi:FAR1-related sequence 5-like protein [Tanacetum coccineum]|uniref:FAR1-related sequence 5-like protein n=1 Tax=Tanacetum coccineum TaxID=301880 RepID=A0ABQ5DKR1_9ASTR
MSIPFAFDTFGFLASEAMELLSRVQRVMHNNVMTLRSTDVVFIKTRISFQSKKGSGAQLVCPHYLSPQSKSFLIGLVDKAVDTRRGAEEDEDFKTMNSMPILSSVHPIEAKAGKCYTKKIFEIFQKEWIEATNNLTHETKSKSSEQTSYWVGHVNVDKKYWRVVNYRLLDNLDVTCSCAMFETYGVLCKHILYVMKKKHVETLPDHYILPRWTLDCRYKASNASIGIEETSCENGVSALALWYVQANWTKAIEQARDAPTEIKRLNNFLVEFLEDQMIRKKPTELENVYKDTSVGTSQVDMMPQISVRDPVVLTKIKGRPREATKSPQTSLRGKQKKTVTLSICREPWPQQQCGCKRKKKALSLQDK